MKNRIIAILLFCTVGTQAQVQETRMEQTIDSLLALMTLEEKVAMCHAQSKFSSPGVPRLGIPELWMADGPHGVRAEISWDSWNYAGWTSDSITAFPALTCLAATFNPGLSGEYGFALGEEARYRKKDVLLGPGINIYRTPLSGRNFEYMGEDPHLASMMVVPYIEGVQRNGVAACLKHFALNNQEQWRFFIDVDLSDRALHEIYLPAYKAAVQKGGLWSMMSAYNRFRGQYCSQNDLLLTRILKREWRFDGVVISDWSAVHDTREAALNGLDIEMGTGTDGLTASTKNAYDYYYLAKPFREMIRSGDIAESVVDEKVRRILRLMLRTTMNPGRPLGRMNNEEHLSVARNVAREGIVLLKNENGFFPLDPERKMTIAVIGENATRSMTAGGGSSELKAKHEISPLEGVRKRFRNATIIHAPGYASGPPAYGRELPSPLDADSLRRAAVQAAAAADVVLFIGGLNKNYRQDCEAGDRRDLALPFGQDDLLKELTGASENIGVVLISGNAVSMPWLSRVRGVMQAWYLGSEAGRALADVISGDVNPSGKLPFTFPARLEDSPAHVYGERSYPGKDGRQVYQEGIFVGYRWYDTRKITPLFAFGHGLSYTSFTISDLRTDKPSYAAGETIIVTCSVRNSGDRAGAEVVQVYAGKPGSPVERAVKELKAFRKTYLEPGEKRTVTLTIDTNDLAWYDESIPGWNLEPGAYSLYAGNASDAVPERVTITIAE
ncbi:glycoside hydrolase family 3 C-terminal domain-containing protein [bacterium]|nr:glycoside hydrolase family 3 C-terminal domain-containing protein [bacterium]